MSLPERLPLWILVLLVTVGLGIEAAAHHILLWPSKLPVMALLAWGLASRRSPKRTVDPPS